MGLERWANGNFGLSVNTCHVGEDIEGRNGRHLPINNGRNE